MVSSQQILLVAAEPREFAGILQFCSDIRRLDWPVYWSKQAELDGRQLWMVANGAGSLHAARAVEVALERCRPQAIVSVGFCGALDPHLEIGDIFVAAAIAAGERRFDMCLPDSKARHSTGVLASVARVAQTDTEKARLRSVTGASAVEMEAAGVAECAAERRIPLFCVRSITDLAAESFVTDFNQALRDDGHFDTIKVLASALRNPGRALPELLRLRHHCQIATRNLGEFIVGCRF
jgi:adenosylhomocysteine nucleosidase